MAKDLFRFAAFALGIFIGSFIPLGAEFTRWNVLGAAIVTCLCALVVVCVEAFAKRVK